MLHVEHNSHFPACSTWSISTGVHKNPHLCTAPSIVLLNKTEYSGRVNSSQLL